MNIGSWPDVKCKGGTPCDDLLESWLHADRVILATAGTMRRVGGLERALVGTVRGILVWGWGMVVARLRLFASSDFALVDPRKSIVNRTASNHVLLGASLHLGREDAG